MLDVLIGIALGVLLGLALIGLAEILTTAKKLFDEWRNRRTVFIPIATLRNEARYNSAFQAVVRAIDDDDDSDADVTGVYIEDDATGDTIHYQKINSELKDEVSSRGYTVYKNDDRLYTR